MGDEKGVGRQLGLGEKGRKEGMAARDAARWELRGEGKERRE